MTTQNERLSLSNQKSKKGLSEQKGSEQQSQEQATSQQHDARHGNCSLSFADNITRPSTRVNKHARSNIKNTSAASKEVMIIDTSEKNHHPPRHPAAIFSTPKPVAN